MATLRQNIMRRLMTSATKRATPWLCFTAEEDGCVIRLNKLGSPNPVQLETSINGGKTWVSYSWSGNRGAAINLNRGDMCYWRGTNGTFSTNASNCYRFSTGRVSASGNIMSLIGLGKDEVPSYAFARLFYNCTGLQTAPELPATTLNQTCYNGMFHGCTGLQTAPELPATTLAQNCYYDMFNSCTVLQTAPELPATTLVSGAYYRMFNGCTSLRQLKIGFTSWRNDALTNWLDGVAAEGTFECPDELPDPPSRGASTVPEDWTIVRPSDGYVQSGLVFQLDAKRLKTSSTWTDIKGAVELAISNNVATGLGQNFPKGYTIEICAEQRVPLVSPPYSLESWEPISINFGEDKAALALQGYQRQQVQIISTGELAYIYVKLLVKTNEGEFDAGYGQGLLEGILTIVSAQTTGETAYIKNEAKILDSVTLTTSSGTRIEGVKYIKSIRVYSRALTDTERLHNYNLDKQRFGL